MNSNETLEQTTKEGWENYRKAKRMYRKTVTDLIREKFMGEVPFCSDEDVSYVLDWCVSNKEILKPENMTESDFKNELRPLVTKATNELRTRAQTAMKTQWESKLEAIGETKKGETDIELHLIYCSHLCKTFTEDKDSEEVPSSFPGLLQLMIPDEESDEDYEDITKNVGYIEGKCLHKDYRRKNTPEFEYFTTKLLHRIGVNRIQFEKKKRTNCLSDIFTVEDEAFGLLVLSNEYKNWKKQRELKASGKRGNSLRLPKRFVNGDSGQTMSWSTDGIQAFEVLCVEIEELRATEESKKIEHEMRLKFDEETPKSSFERPRKQGSSYMNKIWNANHHKRIKKRRLI